MDGPERPDGHGQLARVGGQEAIQLGAQRLPADLPEVHPLVSRIGAGEDDGGPGRRQDFVEDRADVDVQVDGQDAVHLGQPVP